MLLLQTLFGNAVARVLIRVIPRFSALLSQPFVVATVQLFNVTVFKLSDCCCCIANGCLHLHEFRTIFYLFMRCVTSTSCLSCVWEVLVDAIVVVVAVVFVCAVVHLVSHAILCRQVMNEILLSVKTKNQISI